MLQEYFVASASHVRGDGGWEILCQFEDSGS